jgi:hypothetical protein
VIFIENQGAGFMPAPSNLKSFHYYFNAGPVGFLPAVSAG